MTAFQACTAIFSAFEQLHEADGIVAPTTTLGYIGKAEHAHPYSMKIDFELALAEPERSGQLAPLDRSSYEAHAGFIRFPELSSLCASQNMSR